METQLEPAIAAMVTEFIAAGRPKASSLSWQERRKGYLASAILGGQQEEVGAAEEWQNGHYSVRLYQPASTSSASRPALIYFLGKELEAQAEHQQEQRSEQAKAAQ